MTENLVEVEDVVLRFSGVTAIDGARFHVGPDELFAIIGPNGAGKTSIFNVLSGVYRPQEGSVRFLGEDVLQHSPDELARMGMARTFQNIELFDNLTVIDNLMLGRHVHTEYKWWDTLWYSGRAKREELEHRAVVEDLVDFLEIQQYRKFPVGLLPYGYQKRVELGRALAMEPKLLLLDEPVAGMNVEETEDMARFILDIRDELHISMILVEHDMGLVMDIADRVMAVDFGVPLATGTPGEVQRHPEVIKAYLGDDSGARGAAAAARRRAEERVQEKAAQHDAEYEATHTAEQIAAAKEASAADAPTEANVAAKEAAESERLDAPAPESDETDAADPARPRPDAGPDAPDQERAPELADDDREQL